MAENFYTMLTITGKNKLSNSVASGNKLNFKTLKVGDGKGAYYEPSENQTALVNTVWTGNITSISIDENNSNWIVVETVIPAADGGFFIREAGIFDDAGDMIAISKLAETYKPIVSEGSTKDLVIKIVFEILNVDSVTLKIDPNVVVATKNDVQVLESKFQDINARLTDLANEVSGGSIITPTVSYGMNNKITMAGKNSVSPKFTIKGKTVINLLGKDGNCEDVSKWLDYQGSHVLDSSNKVFGPNSFKVAIGSGYNGCAITKDNTNIDFTKYYCVSAYVKNGNATSVNINSYSNGTGKAVPSSNASSDTTKFNRVFVKLKPSDYGTGSTYLRVEVDVVGTVAGQYAYVDGIMIEEITSSQYADSSFTPSPYVDSYSCLQNPYIEVRHDNLVRNGNVEEGTAWWTIADSSSSLSIENNKLKLTSTTTFSKAMYQKVPVKPNTNYYLSGNITNGTTSGNLLVYINEALTLQIGSSGTYVNSGSNNFIYICMFANSSGYVYFDSIMLVEGTIVPASYKSCRIERVVLETKLTSDDSIVYDNGEVTGSLLWKHKTLFGKDYDWQYANDGTGFKQMRIPINLNMLANSGTNGLYPVVKYDGTIQNAIAAVAANNFWTDISNNILYGCVLDTDTGWTESINPNNDEVKAFMNGWKAIYNNGTRYLSWVSIVDGTCPTIQPSTTVTVASGVGGNIVVSVADSSKFAVGDYVVVIGSNYISYSNASITSVGSNTITIAAVNMPIPVGTVLTRIDNGSTDTRILNYCKNNVATGYEGYQLHYKLATPERITDDNCHIHGDIPLLDIGDNYLCLDSGMVLREIANPVFNGNGAYFINHMSSIVAGDILKNKVEDILYVYKNSLLNMNLWTKYSGNGGGYGNTYVNIATANMDTNALYTVDYKILATIAPQIGSIGCSYTQDIVTAINKLSEEVNNKQVHDSTLDSIVDSSLYEVVDEARICKWWYLNSSTSMYIDVFVPILPKKTVTTVTIGSIVWSYWTGTAIVMRNTSVPGITLSAIYQMNATMYLFRFVCSDTTIQGYIKNYGIEPIISNIIFDCRNRI